MGSQLVILVPYETWITSTSSLYSGFYCPPSIYSGPDGAPSIISSYSSECGFYFNQNGTGNLPFCELIFKNNNPTWNEGTFTLPNGSTSNFGYSSFNLEVNSISKYSGDSSSLSFTVNNIYISGGVNSSGYYYLELYSLSSSDATSSKPATTVSNVKGTGTFSSVTSSDITLATAVMGTDPYIVLAGGPIPNYVQSINYIQSNYNNFTLIYRSDTTYQTFNLYFNIANLTIPSETSDFSG